MLFLGLPRLVLMAVMLCTLAAAAGDRVIPYTTSLGLEFSSRANDGWRLVKGPDGFSAEVYVSSDDKYIAVSHMVYDDGKYDSYEALLSIWERESGFGASRLQRIKYYNVNKRSDISIFDQIFARFDYDPEEDDEISIKRDDELYADHWMSLRSTTFGSDAIDICTEFKETEGMYIASFDIGKTGYDGRWIRVNFEMND
ncbi:hypothetical protein HOO65_030947 [Ceratocystis lukuohia]|uniref:Uncharacterized protein n=1 Tax=Ceratocystis lukuohia TaxID=2019550 RepID=A0ABR4MMH4_9PEZI